MNKAKNAAVLSLQPLYCAELVSEALRPYCRKADYKAGEVIVYAGQPIHEVGFILSGSASGVSFLPSGDTMEPFRMDAEYGVIGLAELLNEQSSIQYTVAASEQTEVLYLPLEMARRHMLTDADCMRRYARLLTRNVGRYNLRPSMYYRSAAEKLCYYICYYCQARLQQGQSIVLQHSYRQIANNLGLSTQSVYRAVRDLTAEGLLGRQGRSVCISYEQYLKLEERV
ncbi:MAG: Crp/Fnr family transcriptional regulator [Oscillospiraceae bacterium]|nr:Crp/Fnr family transcriptional regulator [Oscillospiraceae bacterium]